MEKPKPRSRRPLDPDRDTMRPEYDFSGGVRGVTAARYCQGTSIVLLDPAVEALRALAPVLRRRRRTAATRRSA
jgi:hypothetical protein